MMIHLYKSGGAWKKDGKEYTIKAVNSDKVKAYIDNGWVRTLEEVKAKRKAKPKKEVVANDDNKE